MCSRDSLQLGVDGRIAATLSSFWTVIDPTGSRAERVGSGLEKVLPPIHMYALLAATATLLRTAAGKDWDSGETSAIGHVRWVPFVAAWTQLALYMGSDLFKAVYLAPLSIDSTCHGADGV